jgi:hypothetical protein
MNWETISIFVLGSAVALLAWLGRELWAAVKALRTDLDTLRVNLAERYPTYDRLAEVMRPIQSQLSRIEDALVAKADKP